MISSRQVVEEVEYVFLNVEQLCHAAPYSIPAVYILVNVAFIPLMVFVFDNYKLLNDAWRIMMLWHSVIQLLMCTILGSIGVGGSLQVLAYSLSDGLTLVAYNRPPPFGLSERYPILHYCGTVTVHHFMTLMLLFLFASGAVKTICDDCQELVIILVARNCIRRLCTMIYYKNKEWRSAPVCLFTMLAVVAVEIGSVVFLYLYLGLVSIFQFVFVFIDLELLLALCRQCKNARSRPGDTSNDEKKKKKKKEEEEEEEEEEEVEVTSSMPASLREVYPIECVVTHQNAACEEP